MVHSFSKYSSSVYNVTIPALVWRDPTTISPGFNLFQLNLCSIILNAIDALNEFDTITHKLNPGPGIIPGIYLFTMSIFMNSTFVTFIQYFFIDRFVSNSLKVKLYHAYFKELWCD